MRLARFRKPKSNDSRREKTNDIRRDIQVSVVAEVNQERSSRILYKGDEENAESRNRSNHKDSSEESSVTTSADTQTRSNDSDGLGSIATISEGDVTSSTNGGKILPPDDYDCSGAIQRSDNTSSNFVQTLLNCGMHKLPSPSTDESFQGSSTDSYESRYPHNLEESSSSYTTEDSSYLLSVHNENFETVLREDGLPSKYAVDEKTKVLQALNLVAQVQRSPNVSSKKDLVCLPCNDQVTSRQLSLAPTSTAHSKSKDQMIKPKRQSDVEKRNHHPLLLAKSYLNRWKEKKAEKNGRKKEFSRKRDVAPAKSKGCWKAALDSKTGRHYFYHTETKQTTWEKPASFVVWKMTMDKASGRPYFYNRITKETSWEKPPDFVEWKSAVDAASGKTYYYNVITRETLWTKPTDKGGKENNRPSNDKDNAIIDVPQTGVKQLEEKVGTVESSGIVVDNVPEAEVEKGFEYKNVNQQRLGKLLSMYAPSYKETNEALLTYCEGNEGPILKAIDRIIDETPFDEVDVAVFRYASSILEGKKEISEVAENAQDTSVKGGYSMRTPMLSYVSQRTETTERVKNTFSSDAIQNRKYLESKEIQNVRAREGYAPRAQTLNYIPQRVESITRVQNTRKYSETLQPKVNIPSTIQETPETNVVSDDSLSEADNVISTKASHPQWGGQVSMSEQENDGRVLNSDGIKLKTEASPVDETESLQYQVLWPSDPESSGPSEKPLIASKSKASQYRDSKKEVHWEKSFVDNDNSCVSSDRESLEGFETVSDLSDSYSPGYIKRSKREAERLQRLQQENSKLKKVIELERKKDQKRAQGTRRNKPKASIQQSSDSEENIWSPIDFITSWFGNDDVHESWSSSETDCDTPRMRRKSMPRRKNQV